MSNEKPRVAIVGGGSAGTTAAYRLWKEYGDRADITLYEREEHVGGRAWDITFAGTRIEVGGTILHSSGKHVMELMAFTGSVEGESGLSIDGKDETYGFWTDKGFPVLCHTSLASMAAGILRHVGPYSALKVTNEATAMAAKWEGVYALQEAGRRFQSPDDLLEALDLADPSRESLGDFLRERHVNRAMAEDIVEAITHNMYNQGLEMNAFAGLVGLAGAGLAGGYLYSIDGGNWTVFAKTLDRIGADVRLKTSVVSVDVKAGEGGRRTFEVEDSTGRRDHFDAVILAAPVALGDYRIQLEDTPLNVPAHPYQKVNTTFVVGDINPAYFKGRRRGGRVPSTAFTATSSGAPFKSIGVTGFSPDYGKRIYKIFSADHEMTPEELGRIFERIGDVRTFVWRGAYPVLTPGIRHVPFTLAPGLFYACAFETAAGSVEVEAVGGTNAALLAIDYLDAL
ncbi:MAG: FAD-dependent oxidoreductase [Coriobacteriaceae bacterium]|nr:FAD-dependent oxidoreductase [Coriobacteriaceae bacterium]